MGSLLGPDTLLLRTLPSPAEPACLKGLRFDWPRTVSPGPWSGAPLPEAKLVPPSLRRFRRRMVGAQVTAIDTRGKAMLTRFDNGLSLYSHNQLYGRWYVTRRDRSPNTGRSLRVALHTDSHSAWLYSATDIEVLDAAGEAAPPFSLPARAGCPRSRIGGRRRCPSACRSALPSPSSGCPVS